MGKQTVSINMLLPLVLAFFIVTSHWLVLVFTSEEIVKAAGELCHRCELKRDACFCGAGDCSLQLWPLSSNMQRLPGSAGTDGKQRFCRGTRVTEGLTSSAWKSCSLCCSVMLFCLWIFTEVKALKLLKMAEQNMNTWGWG